MDERGCTLPARPIAGEMDRAGTFGGGPGSAPGERRKDLEGPGACIVKVVVDLPSSLFLSLTLFLALSPSTPKNSGIEVKG